MLDNLEPRYDVKTVARRYGVVPRTVVRWIEAGLLRAIQPPGTGSRYRIPASALDEFEARYTVGGVPTGDAAENDELPPASNE